MCSVNSEILLFVCPPFCPNRILTAARSQLKLISLAAGELLVCPLLGSIFDKLITLEVAKLITFKWLYVFPHLGLLGPYFEKPEPNSNANGHVGGQTNNFVRTFMLFFWFFVVVFLFCPCSLLMFFSLLLILHLMLAYYKQTNKKDKKTKKTKETRKKERKERKQREAQKEKPNSNKGKLEK